MITVPQAAQRVGRNAETVRRWIRTGRLRSMKVGTQHLIDEDELDRLVEEPEPLPVPDGWGRYPDGTPSPDWVRVIRRSREGH